MEINVCLNINSIDEEKTDLWTQTCQEINFYGNYITIYNSLLTSFRGKKIHKK